MSNLTNDEGLHMAVWADALKEGNALYNISAFPYNQSVGRHFNRNINTVKIVLKCIVFGAQNQFKNRNRIHVNDILVIYRY